MCKVYKLAYDLDRMKFSEDYDYWQVDNTRHINSLFWKAKLIEFPKSIRFEGQLERLEKLDYPYYIKKYPFMSRLMLKTLLAVKPFSYQEISIPIYNCNSVQNSRFTDKFVLVNLLKHTEGILDSQNTKYFEDTIDEPALKEPPQGYPSLFRISEFRTVLYVSAEAKEALESANLKGVKFIKLFKS